MAAPLEFVLRLLSESPVDLLKIAFLSYLLACALVYLCITNDILSLKSDKDSDLVKKKILILTAHPDDECMFFSPTIIYLSKTSEVFVMCTTSGNYYKKGEERKKELLESCKILGVADHNVQVLDNSAFPDDPNAVWDLALLGNEMRATINRFQPDYVLTFDHHGVSGHSNHIFVSKAARQIVHRSNFSHGAVKLLELETVGLLRKYTSFLELPFSLKGDLVTFVSPFTEILRAQKAMCAHNSQMVWFRVLYVIFSRYMVINTFREVTS
ncbi:phosphatidylinositol glycan anchor biosynthesis, class L [Elysia marginata]|uniref:N-acetylglucosaminylphosphatidylinositol deacetylase n=1 Tax=Elysia marginata TaxID=1093978 RepID=A0AAV4H2A4_9GAST|nr:phosphatidylinositol glycan anchor biosynthesis, class L [Elysia marginata]